jgi:predicted extracellular nuclease
MLRGFLRLAVAVLALAAPTTALAAPPTELFFSEYIEGTSNNKALEIYNGTPLPVPLVGYSVEMYFNGSTSAGLTAPLTGTVAAGDVFVLANPSAVDAILAQADQKTILNTWYNGDDAVVLRHSGAIVDVIGQIGFDPGTEWGSGLTSTADNTLRRKVSITAGDTNGSDIFNPTLEWDGFATDTFDGLGVHGNTDTPPSVTSTSPADGATDVPVDSNLSVTFSEPVTLAPGAVTISCATSGNHASSITGGPTTFTVDPTANFVQNETCTITVVGTGVSDADAQDPPDTMTANFTFRVTTVAPPTITRIHKVQGSTDASQMVGQTATIEGVVVGDYQGTGQFSGYFVEEEDADQDTDPTTSEGIFVFSSTPVNLGELVRVRGTVQEFFGQTELSSVSLQSRSAATAPVTAATLTLPVTDVGVFEQYEGMKVALTQNLTVTEVFGLGRFGEVGLSGAGRLYTPTAVAMPGPAATAVEAQNARSRIVLDDGINTQNPDPVAYPQGGLSSSNTLRVGDSTSSVLGVMDFRRSASGFPEIWRIQPLGPDEFVHTNPRTAAPEPVGGNLTIASFNVLNFFNGNGSGLDGVAGGFPTARGANSLAEFNRQRAKEVSALSAINADVVGLMEMENDAPPNSAVESLVGGLNARLGAGTYSFVDTGVIGTDEIKVALIYKPGSVTPVGTWKILTTAVDPRFVDTKNRPSLAQTFRDNRTGRRFTVVVNHLKSKGSDCNDLGDPDTGDGSGNCNITRTNAAKALVDWLRSDPTGSGDTDFLLIGDMNSYTFEDPIEAFVAGGLANLVRKYDGLAGYSYVFDGESGYLDHALATPSFEEQIAGVGHWHINPDEPAVLDYNVEFKSPGQVASFYSDEAYRSSDHDPVVIGVQLADPPTANAGGPYTVAEGGSTTLAGSGTGNGLTYEWDLDGDGTFEAAGQNPTFSAAALDGPTTRPVTLRVSDGELTVNAAATVTVVNVAPTATLHAPPSASAGLPYTLSLTNAADPAAADAAAGFAYAFDCGSGLGRFTSAATATCTTSTVGPHAVRAAIRDKDGGVNEYSATVDVTVTAVSLCTLTERYVTKEGVAHSLCVKLEHGSWRAYANEVDAQSGKSMTAEQAAVLKQLVGRLA